jgi:guanidinopropionase
MKTEEITSEILSYMDWWGVPTMFRCPYDPDPANADIALVGVPHSSGNGTTERDQHLGPRALRNVSPGYRRTHRRFRFSPWESCRISDVGDPPMPSAMVNDRAVREIEAFFKKIDAAGARPVSVGGDHSVTLPILRAIAGPNSNIAGEPVAIVHFDAHADTFKMEDFLGNKDWAGNWGWHMNEEGLVDPTKVIQIGLRGHPGGFEMEQYSHDAGYRVIYKDEFDELGVKAVVEEIRAKIDDRTPTYITFDLDSLDPSVAPGVANIEPGFEGLTMKEATGVLQGLRGMNIIGGDVVCMMPTKDSPNKITAINASVIMFEQICLIADRVGTIQPL